MQNTAASSSAVTLTLDERFPLKIALTTATDVAIVPHPCHEMITCTIATDAIPLGVAPTVVADNEYFWMQTKGNGLCIAEGTIGLGDDVWLSDTTDGAVATPAGTAVGDLVTEARVGVANFAPDSTGHVSVALGLSGW